MDVVETVYLTAGARARPVRLRREGKLLALSFGYSAPLVEEVKCLKGARWHPARGECKHCGVDCKFSRSWTATDCARNHIQLELLQGRVPKELERYEVPLADAAPRRALWDHQVAMFRHGVTRRCAIWAAEPSTGKTLAVFEVAEWAADNLGFTDFWWVSPLNTQKATRLEAQKWGCRVPFKYVHYDILATELEARYRCSACGREVPESRMRDRGLGCRCGCPSERVLDRRALGRSQRR